MRLLPLALALPLLWASACGSPPPPTTPPPAPPAPSASSSPASELPDDPNAVRCGVDDRPRPLGEDERPPRASGAERSLLGEPLPSPPPPEQRAVMRQKPRFAPPSPPALEVKLEQGAARVIGSGSAGASTSGLAGAAGPEACEPLAAVSDTGALELGVDLASTAEPLRVRSSRPGAPSPYVRCLMERACQIKVAQGSGAKQLALPLTVEVREPPPPPPAEPEKPASAVAVHPDKGKAGDELHRQAAVMVFSRGTACVTGQQLPAGTFKLKLDLERRDPPRGGSFLGAPPPMFMGPTMVITHVVSEGPIASEHKGLAQCLMRSLQGSAFPGRGQMPRKGKVKVEVEVMAVR